MTEQAVTTQPRSDKRGFDVSGLPGYRVVMDRDGYWWFVTTGPVVFDWNEATQRHDVPVYRDWCNGRRGTAKAAVAAAHAHARWVREQTSVAA